MTNLKERLHDNCGLFAHPELLDLMERMFALDETGSLSDTECDRLIWSATSVETLCTDFHAEIRAIDGALPDPGSRPLQSSIWPYHDRKPRDFNAALGFIWRVIEWTAKVEAKYAKAVA